MVILHVVYAVITLINVVQVCVRWSERNGRKEKRKKFGQGKMATILKSGQKDIFRLIP